MLWNIIAEIVFFFLGSLLIGKMCYLMIAFEYKQVLFPRNVTLS